MRGKYSEMEELKTQEESRQQRVSKAKKDLEAAELELANLPVFEHPRDKLVGSSCLLQNLKFIRAHNFGSYCNSYTDYYQVPKKLMIPWCCFSGKKKLIIIWKKKLVSRFP